VKISKDGTLDEAIAERNVQARRDRISKDTIKHSMDLKHDIIDDPAVDGPITTNNATTPNPKKNTRLKEEGKEEDHARAGERELIVKFGKKTCEEIERGGDLESEDVKRCNPDLLNMF